MVKRLLGGLVMAGAMALLFGQAVEAGSPQMHETRQAADDLEVTGLGVGSKYLSYAELSAMPQVTKDVNLGVDFGRLPMRVSGVYLEELARRVGAREGGLIDALCSDKYRAYFSREYVARHRPMLVLMVDGMRPGEWAAKHHQYDPSPYFVGYAEFVPSFHVLAHEDEELLPTNVVRLNFGDETKTFAAIAPKGSYAAGSPVMDGFAIMKQNCLRCHNRGDVGGTKAGWDWTALSAWAKGQPDFFAKYIRDPKSVDPHARMPGNPQYDDATLAALTAYFRTFAE